MLVSRLLQFPSFRPTFSFFAFLVIFRILFRSDFSSFFFLNFVDRLVLGSIFNFLNNQIFFIDKFSNTSYLHLTQWAVLDIQNIIQNFLIFL